MFMKRKSFAQHLTDLTMKGFILIYVFISQRSHLSIVTSVVKMTVSHMKLLKSTARTLKQRCKGETSMLGG